MHLVTILCVVVNQIRPFMANERNDYSLPEEHWLNQNSLLHTFLALEQEWNISFEVNPSRVEEGTRNILRLVFFEAGERHTVFEISMKSSTCFTGWQGCQSGKRLQLSCKYMRDSQTLSTFSFQHSYVYPLPNQWIKVEVRKEYHSINYHKISLKSGGRTSTRYVVNQRILQDVELYASDPHQEAQPGRVKGLHIINGQIGLCHKFCVLKYIIRWRFLFLFFSTVQ